MDKKSMFYKSGRKAGSIYWWQNGAGKWFWEALGNGGEEATEDGAIEAAKRYIRGEKEAEAV